MTPGEGVRLKNKFRMCKRVREMTNEPHARAPCQVTHHSGNKMLQLFNVGLDFPLLPKAA